MTMSDQNMDGKKTSGIDLEQLAFDENGQVSGLDDAILDAVSAGIAMDDTTNMNCVCGDINGDC